MAAKKNTTAGTGKQKAAAKLDAFGSRVGSKAAKVNAMLGKEPVTMKQIREKVGHNYYNHLGDLIKAGKVKKTDDGYVIA